MWATWQDTPTCLVVDQDGAFESDFADKINALGSVLETDRCTKPLAGRPSGSLQQGFPLCCGEGH